MKQTCPLCKTEAAMGWWCMNCKHTMAKAGRLKKLKDGLAPDCKTAIVALATPAILLIVLILNRLFGNW